MRAAIASDCRTGARARAAAALAGRSGAAARSAPARSSRWPPRNARARRRHRAPEAIGRRARTRARAPDVALVGKGILFDTGGVNLKPHRSMLDMHTDMAGSAVALATLVALAELRAPARGRRLARHHREPHRPDAPTGRRKSCAPPTASPSRSSTPTPKGAWCSPTRWRSPAAREPRFMIDFATLTGACVYALTERMSGVFTNRPALVPKLRRGRARERRARLEFPVRRGLRHRPREQGRRHRAVRASTARAITSSRRVS